MVAIDDRFLDALFRGVTDYDQFAAALARLQDMFGCRGAALVTVDAQDPTADLVFTSGVLQEHMKRYVDQYSQIDPAPALFLRLPAGRAQCSDRMFTSQYRAADPIYNEFFLPIGVVETLGGPLYSQQGSFAMVSLLRGAQRPSFDDDDIARLESLMPHLARAVQLRRTFLRIDARNLGLQAMLDRQRAGIVLIAPAGSVIFVNAAMRAIVDRGDGLSFDQSGRPVPAQLEARRNLAALLKRVAAGGKGGIVGAPRDHGRDYVMLVTPAPTSMELSYWDEGGPGSMAASIVIHDPDIDIADTSELLAQALKLPSGAARLVAALAGGSDLKGFAAAEDVTIHTARFHLRSALVRTGTRTQADLVRVAVRLLRDLALAGNFIHHRK